MRLILDHVSVDDPRAIHATPGEVVISDGQRLHVATGQGILALDRIQPAGKRVMQMEELLRGYPVSPGDRFGPLP